MLPDDGAVVAGCEVTAEQWLRAIPGGQMPVALVAGSGRGWFSGRTVVAWAPEFVAPGIALARAAEELQGAFDSDSPCMAVALLPYEGAATVARYGGGIVLTDAGWRVWGALRPGGVPAVGADAAQGGVPADRPLVRDACGTMSGGGFRQAVETVREEIARGNVYVLNLTYRLSGEASVDPVSAFGALLARTDADMAAYWEPGVTLASASPERFVRVSGDRIEVCPIKGTRPRAPGVADIAMAAELASSVKERAEHVMIVDLERNDIGLVCEAGSVSVDPLFEIRATPYCHQMVSTVQGRMRPDATLADVLAATFPCGSVTGAPKRAAMRTIAALETSPRGAYTGSLVVAVPGEMDSSVLIRTAEYAGDRVTWGTGGGITIDSDPAEEWRETLLKAVPFLGAGPGCAPAP